MAQNFEMVYAQAGVEVDSQEQVSSNEWMRLSMLACRRFYIDTFFCALIHWNYHCDRFSIVFC